MSVDPSRSSQERAAVVHAAMNVRAQAGGPVALHGAGERRARAAGAYLAAVDVFRAEGSEPEWRSEDGAIPSRSLHRLGGAGEVSAAGKGIEG